jgi:hypothetical protein
MLNAYAVDQAIEAANTVLEAVRPEGDASPPATAGYSQFPGLDFDPVIPYLVAVADPESAISANRKRIGVEIREKLGKEVADRIARSISIRQNGATDA